MMQNDGIVVRIEQRKRYRAFWDEYDRRFQAWMDAGCPRLPNSALLTMPADLVGLQCGAKTRAGTPCKMQPIRRNGRCKYHGGLSTGPKSEEGKRKVALNGKGRQPKSMESLSIPDILK